MTTESTPRLKFVQHIVQELPAIVKAHPQFLREKDVKAIGDYFAALSAGERQGVVRETVSPNRVPFC